MSMSDSLARGTAGFDGLIREVADRFGLGPQAGALVREVLRFITETPGGIAGFLDKFRNAGLGGLVTSWVGKTDSQPLSVMQMESSLGAGALDGIARRLGLAKSVIAPAAAFLIPKIVDLLTPDGFVPNTLPPQASAFLSGGAAGREQVVSEPERRRGIPPWLWGALALAAIALLGYWFFGRPAEQVATRPQVSQPVPPVSQVTPAAPARLALNNVDGRIRYDGTVGDEQTRSGIIAALQRVFGAENASGTITVDPAVGPASWLTRLEAALQNFKIPGAEMLLQGNRIGIGGAIPQGDFDRLKQSLASLFGEGFTLTSLESLSTRFGEAKTKTIAALNSLKPGFTSNDLVSALNLSIINFETGSSAITAESREILQKAAAAMKSAPAGTRIEVGGHTDSSGDPAANMTLSQQRAEAVRAALIGFGVDQGILTAKGYGDSQPIASNDTPDGRLQNRRIQFVVVP